MIHHLKGRLVEKHPTHVVIECNGVGYFVNISLHTFALIPDEETLYIYTHFHVREDAQSLYGFMEAAERDIFRLLISVSGIGTSTARTMLSSMSPTQIRDAIAGADVHAIQAVKGIGAKTAQRVIIDLKDKILKIYDMAEVSEKSDNTNKEEALSALEVLGFASKQAEKAIDKALSGDPSLSVEAIIKQALKNL